MLARILLTGLKEIGFILLCMSIVVLYAALCNLLGFALVVAVYQWVVLFIVIYYMRSQPEEAPAPPPEPPEPAKDAPPEDTQEIEHEGLGNTWLQFDAAPCDEFQDENSIPH